MYDIILSLGANSGDALLNIKAAVRYIKKAGYNITSVSSIYKTQPYGSVFQRDFLNCAVKITAKEKPLYRSLIRALKVFKSIEEKLGRKKSVKWGSREMDIDIICAGNLFIDKKDLKVPHRGLLFRKFVLMPIKELDPGFKHPVLKIPINRMLKDSCDLRVERIAAGI